ncbi:hypothetical protein [Duganella vulcania]|uniref:Uncharacterized protein n=1 Tax=Duganella vulcania TaxID=2692166 RepID=A0A845GED0_9BURK|nr:hypothetical protein [Duganella vulcania]MYM92654.1 hypothetical protein [Duganella vulcania]
MSASQGPIRRYAYSLKPREEFSTGERRLHFLRVMLNLEPDVTETEMAAGLGITEDELRPLLSSGVELPAEVGERIWPWLLSRMAESAARNGNPMSPLVIEFDLVHCLREAAGVPVVADPDHDTIH